MARRDADDIVEELFLLVAARLAAVPDGRARLRGAAGGHSAIPDARQELLLLSPSVLVPRLTHDGVAVWDTLAIAEYLNEIAPEAQLLPADRGVRAHCRSVSGEIHSGFYNLRSALPMNLKARHESFKIFSGARPDVERIKTIRAGPLKAEQGFQHHAIGPQPTVRRRRRLADHRICARHLVGVGRHLEHLFTGCSTWRSGRPGFTINMSAPSATSSASLDAPPSHHRSPTGPW